MLVLYILEGIMVITRDDSELMVYAGDKVSRGFDGMWLNIANLFDSRVAHEEIGTLISVSREEDGRLHLYFNGEDDERMFIEMTYEQQVAFTNGSIVRLYVW